jgi:hypothetical protein
MEGGTYALVVGSPKSKVEAECPPAHRPEYIARGTKLLKVFSLEVRKFTRPNNMLFVDDEPSIRLTLPRFWKSMDSRSALPTA